MRSIVKRLNITENEFKTFLLKEYKTKSQKQIADKLNCHIGTIENWFKKFNIKIRNDSEKQILRKNRKTKILFKQNNILLGMILSDFHIDKQHHQPRITFGFKHKEFAEDLIKNLNCFQWSKLYQDKKTNCWHSKSLAYETLIPIYEKWYKNKKKVVPKDLKLNADILYWWFLGDGKRERYAIILCSESFSKIENKFLIKKINDLGINAKITSQNRIRIGTTKEINKFYKLIGKCKNKCYEYKF